VAGRPVHELAAGLPRLGLAVAQVGAGLERLDGGDGQAGQVGLQALGGLCLGGGQVGAAEGLADPDELAVVAVDVAQGPAVVALVRGGQAPHDGGVVPAEPFGVVGVVGDAVRAGALDRVVHGADGARQLLGGRGGAVGGADEERDGVREAHRAAFGVDVAGGDAVDAFGEAGVVVPHPADARVEPLDVGGGDQPEDQRGQVRVDVPDRAART